MRRTKFQKTGQILYRILPADALTREQKDVIDAKVRAIETGDDAEKLAGTDGWGYRKIAHVERRELPTIMPGSLGVLLFNGAEVALYYKRQTVSIQSEECDPVPAYAIKDPRETWVRIEFLHSRSSITRSTWYSEREEQQNAKISALEGLVGSMGVENEVLHSRVVETDKNIEDSKALVDRLKKRMKAATQKSGILQADVDEAFKHIGLLKAKLVKSRKHVERLKAQKVRNRRK